MFLVSMHTRICDFAVYHIEWASCSRPTTGAGEDQRRASATGRYPGDGSGRHVGQERDGWRGGTAVLFHRFAYFAGAE